MSGSTALPDPLGTGMHPSRASPAGRIMSGVGSGIYNPYAPPNMHDMRQANLIRARVHTLGPTFSDEEDGDDTEFIQERMRALGLTDRDVYGNSIYTHVPYPASGPAPMVQPKIQTHLRPTAPEYTPVTQTGPRADPGYRKYGQGDPATSKSYCPYPELASYAQIQRQAQATDMFKQMESMAQAQASARAQLEAMRFQAQMQQYVQDETYHKSDYRHAYAAGHARKKTEEEDEEELLRKLQVVREAKSRKQMESDSHYRMGNLQETTNMLAAVKAGVYSRSASNSSRTSSIAGSPIEARLSPTLPSVPPPSAAAGEVLARHRPHTAEALGSLAALMSRRVTGGKSAEIAVEVTDTNVIDLTLDAPAELDARAMERRKARAGLAALGHGRPRQPSGESTTPPEPTIPASVPVVRVSSQPISPNPAHRTSGTHSQALQMQRRSVTQPILKAAQAPASKNSLQPSAAAYARPVRQPSGPPNESELGRDNFAAMRRRAAGAGLGMLGRRRMESGSTVSDKSDKDDK